MEILRKYATATHVYIPVIKRAVVDFAVSADWTPAAGDVKISIDGAAAGNVTNLPTAITMGNTAMWDFSLTSGELTGKKIMVTVADAATKAVEDQMFIIATYGHASAEYVTDFSDGVRLGLTALPNAAAEAAGGLYTRGAGAGQINQNANGQVDTRTVAMAADVVTAAAVANGAIDAATFALGAIDASAIATDAIGSAEFSQAAADKVWASAARSLTDKAGFALAAAEYTALVNSIWDELTAEVRTAGSYGQLLKDNLNAAVSSRAVPGDAMALTAAAVNAIWDELTAEARSVGSYGQLFKDNINAAISSRAIPGDAMDLVADAVDGVSLATSAGQEIADRILARNIAGGSDAGRVVADALAFLRNKWTLAAGTLTVYGTDDATPRWTAAVTTSAGNPVDSVDPV